MEPPPSYPNDPPERSVFLKPRSWRLSEPGAPEDRAPYPGWFTIPIRAALAGFGIYVLVYITRYHQQSQAQQKSSNTEILLTGVGLGVALDMLIALVSLAGGCHAIASCWAGFLDGIPAVLCGVGIIGVAWQEMRPEDPLRDSRETASSLGIAVCVLHVTASLGGCIGCCITCGRRSAAKAAKKAAASDSACAPAAAAAPSDTELPVGARETQHEEGIEMTGSTNRVFHIDKPDTAHDGKGGYPARTVEEG